MELNDINLLVLTGLVSFPLVGVSLFLTFCGRFLGSISPVVAERIWSWMLTVVEGTGTWGRRGEFWYNITKQKENRILKEP